MWSNSESFQVWVERTHQQLTSGAPAVVPCGDCTACCRSHQFIHVNENEAAYQAIAKDLLVPAPGATGQYLLGHTAAGECPLLGDGRCTIYPDRPHTCRTYDCRIFAASGVFPDRTQPQIAQRARAWQFDYADDHDKAMHHGVKNAATFLLHHQQRIFPTQVNEVQLSLSARKVRAYFSPGQIRDYDPARESARRLAQVRAALQP